MSTFLKKDILVLVRDKTNLFMLLLMPFVFIAILGFALQGLMGGDTEALHMQVAIVQEDDEEHGVGQFVQELEGASLPEEVVNELHGTAVEVGPYALLVDMFNDEDLRDMIETIELDASAAEHALDNEEVAAILTVPENFTYHSLQKMLLDEGGGSELRLTVGDHSSLQVGVFEDVIDNFIRSLNFETALARALGEEGQSVAENDELTEARGVSAELGGLETISASEPISSFQYYTIGMAVMFVLFVASTIAGKAYVEKVQHVFSRILLSGQSPLVYLGGKVVSASAVAFVQLVFLFGLSALIFGSFTVETVHFWLGMVLISAILSICVGAFASLLTALSVRFNNEAIGTVFGAGIVSVFAFAGGSFFPVSDMPEMLRMIGNWTPNGAALSAYLQWMQGLGVDALLTPLSRIAGTSVMLVLVSVLIFPRRGSS